METIALPPDVIEMANRLKRGTHAIVPVNGLEDKLAKSARTGKPLKIKLGLDPTAPDIHLGLAVVLRKLREFQDLGHEVIIIIGDATALIGDPSGRSATRPMLSADEIKSNAKTYVDQLARILDRSKTTVRFNGEWLGRLDFAEVIRLASKMTVAQVMQRDDFATRYTEHQPIGLHELLYPLSQAYDSVAIEADIEMGGQDQTFNILAGRDLQKELGQDPQIGFFMPLLVGLDGVKKMSKSLGNYVGVTKSPDDMFGKLMSLPDEAMRDYFTLCTDVPMTQINALLGDAEAEKANPKDVKRTLAREVITIYHGPEAAVAADAEWNDVHAAGKTPKNLPEVTLPPDIARDGKVWGGKLLVGSGMAASNGKARTLIGQGGVTLNGAKLDNPDAEIPLSELRDAVLQVGPKRYARLKVQ